MAVPLICLATDRTFNFSKFIFQNMEGNVQSATKFLMYPRFLQAILNEYELQPHNRVYITPCLKNKVFQNMTKANEGYNGVVVPLFQQMLAKIGQVQGEGAAIPAVPQHTPIWFQKYNSHHQSSTPLGEEPDRALWSLSPMTLT